MDSSVQTAPTSSAVNGFLLEAHPNGDLREVKLDSKKSMSIDCMREVERISVLLKKYYTLQELGVNFVYDYSY